MFGFCNTRSFSKKMSLLELLPSASYLPVLHASMLYTSPLPAPNHPGPQSVLCPITSLPIMYCDTTPSISTSLSPMRLAFPMGDILAKLPRLMHQKG